jgi:acyl-CoA synthetase (AMP-forming)/AMP-acid ligase II
MTGPASDPAEGRFMERLLAHGLERPGAEALVCGDNRLSWGSLRADVLRAAAAIRAACGAAPGRVAILAASGLPAVTGYLAIVAAGGVAVPLPVSAHPDALAGMLENCAPDLILADGPQCHRLAPEFTARSHVIDETAARLPRALLARVPLAAAEPVSPEAPFNIIYSSGTTGRPKGIVQSHAMRYRQAARGLFGLDPASTMLLSTPLYSNTTLMPLLATLFHGGRVILMPKFDAGGWLDLAERARVTHTMLVPVQYQRILATPGFEARDLSAFRVKQCTGAPLGAALKREIVARWPGRFYEIYGLTEGGCTCILDVAAHPDKAHTVGRPAPGNEIRVIGPDGATLPAGQRGEIVGRSGMMMSGYFRNPGAEAEFCWRDAAGALFHRTGDIGMFDEDGFFVLLDRKKDIIISGGFNIHASDIEQRLLEHPEVAEAAVIGVPSKRWGETPLAFVVLKPGATVDAPGLLDRVNARLGRMQRISAIELRARLPRSEVGKVLKTELRNTWREKTR